MNAGDVLDGRFRLDARAGAGAMGVVFRATDLSRGGAVAVKVLRISDPTDVARFEREAEVLLALQHPSVVRYVAHGRTTAKTPFLVMEWLAGETLRDRLARGPVSTLETIDVGLALASALAGAHARGVVHRDVKPANVFLVGGSTRSVRLLDFGVAALRRGQALTEVGAIVGTPAYMSPEQARGGEVDARSDVFSLGALLFHCLAGERPFEGEDVLEIVLRIVRERAPAVASRALSAPLDLTKLVDAMLEPSPERRPDLGRIAAELARLRAVSAPSLTASHVVPIAPKLTLAQAGPTSVDRPFQQHVGPSAQPPMAGPLAPVVRPTTPAWKRWLVVAGGFYALAALVAVVVFVVTPSRQSHKVSASSEDASARPARGSSAARRAPGASGEKQGASPPSSARVAVRSDPSVVLPVPVPPPAPPSPCDPGTFDMCERLPFDAAHASPDAFLDVCMSAARRVDASARLVLATFSLKGSEVDLSGAAANGTCLFDRGRDPDIVGVSFSGYLMAAKNHDPPRFTRRVFVPEKRCSFASAYASVRARGLEPLRVELTPFGDHAVWTFHGTDNRSVTLNATTCELEGQIASPSPLFGDFQ